jgi:hypothetical protein
MSQEDDEWEQAARDLSRLEVTSKNPPTDKPQINVQKPPFKVMKSPTDSGVGGISSLGDVNRDQDTEDQAIDSAILSAMSNPRERMMLFQVERDFLKFVKSK